MTALLNLLHSDLSSFLGIGAAASMLSIILAQQKLYTKDRKFSRAIAAFAMSQVLVFLEITFFPSLPDCIPLALQACSWIFLLTLIPATTANFIATSLILLVINTALFVGESAPMLGHLLMSVSLFSLVALIGGQYKFYTSVFLTLVFCCFGALQAIAISFPKVPYFQLTEYVGAGMMSAFIIIYIGLSISKKSNQRLALVTSSLIFILYVTCISGSLLCSYIHEQAIGSNSQTLKQNILRLKQSVTALSEESDQVLSQLVSFISSDLPLDLDNGPTTKKLSEKISELFVRSPGAMAYLTDSNDRLVWSSQSSSLILPINELSALAGRIRVRFLREGSPARSFENLGNLNRNYYVAASVIKRSVGGPLTLLFCRPLNWISTSGSNSPQLDFFLGPRGKLILLQGSESFTGSFTPADLNILLAAQSSAQYEQLSERNLVFENEQIPIPGWSVISASHSVNLKHLEMIAKLVSLLISLIITLTLSFNLTAPRLIEVEELLRLQEKSPIKFPEDLADLVLECHKNSSEAATNRQGSSITAVGLIEFLKDFSNYRRSSSSLKMETFDFLKLTKQVEGDLKSLLDANELTIENLSNESSAKVISVTSQHSALKAILHALIQHAARFTPQGSSILMQASIEDKKHSNRSLNIAITHPIKPEIHLTVEKLYDPKFRDEELKIETLEYVIGVEAINFLKGDIKAGAVTGVGARVDLKIPILES